MLLAAELTLVVLWTRMVLACGLGLWSSQERKIGLTQRPPLARVTVVVPAFNEAPVIEGTLRSLLDHVPAPWEIIVVDDGSTDATAAVAHRILAAVERARVIRLSSNMGKAAALNAGIRAGRCPLVVTIDADTRLQPGALGAALAAMRHRRADAVAFHLDADHDGSLLGLLQQQEYAASMNFERAAQDVVGAISVLPGAATLFARPWLLRHPFSNRSRTEDADLTLCLAHRGARIVLARNATVSTQVPASWGELLAQRIRWTAGHLQCSILHARTPYGTTWRFHCVVLPNFLLSTWMPPAALAALLVLWTGGSGELLGLDTGQAASVSVALVYLQRGAAWLTTTRGRVPLLHALLEPAITSFVGTVSFAGAGLSLLRQALRRLMV